MLSRRSHSVEANPGLESDAGGRGWQITSDSSRVVYRTRGGLPELFTTQVHDGSVKKVNRAFEVDESHHGVQEFWISPGSDFIIWTEERHNRFTLWTARSDGSERRILNRPGEHFLAPHLARRNGFPLALSPDGEHLAAAFGSADSAAVRLALISLKTGSRVDLRDDLGSPSDIRFTNDSGAVTYADDRNYYQEVDGGGPVPLSSSASAGMEYSRGGEWAFWTRFDSRGRAAAFGVRLDAPRSTVQLSGWGFTRGTFAWDDSFFYYNKGSAMYRTDLSASTSFELVHLDAPVTEHLSPDNAVFVAEIVGDAYSVSTNPDGPIHRIAKVRPGELLELKRFDSSGRRFLLSIDGNTTSRRTSGGVETLDPRSQFARVVDARFEPGGELVYTAQRADGKYAVFVADGHFCAGALATHVGTRSADVIEGSKKRDVIVGLAGNDTLRGLGARDRLCGGPGDDLLRGGRGPDALHGNGGNDSLIGGSGNDELRGGPGRDAIDGGPGTDSCIGGESVSRCP